MINKDIQYEQAAELRKHAEEISRDNAAASPENIGDLSPEEIRQVLHELRVHQIELEMQNEELRNTQLELVASKERYFDLYNLAPVGYCTVSQKGLILDANLTISSMLGVARSELIKQPISRYILPDSQDIYYRYLKPLFEAGEYDAFDLRMSKNDGTIFWSHLTAAAAQDSDGAPVVRVTMNDITERKQSEEMLRESEEKYRTVANFTFDWEYWISPENRFIYCSPSCERITGYRAGEFENNPDLLKTIVHPDDLAAFSDHLNAVTASDPELHEQELRILSRSGEVRWIAHTCSIVRGNDGTYLGRRGCNRDITARKKADEAIMASETRFRAIINASPVPMALNDEQQLITFLNPAFVCTFGYTLEDIPTLDHWWSQAYPDPGYRQWVADTWQAGIGQAKQTGTAFSPMEVSVRCKKGKSKTVLVSATSLTDTFKDTQLVMLFDISERKRTEELLQKSEERLALVLMATKDAVWDWDLSANALYYSPNWWKLIGYVENELVADLDLWRRLMHPEDLERAETIIREAIAVGTSFELETRLRHKDGHYVPVLTRGFIQRNDAGKPVRVSGANTELTERKKIEERNRQWEQMQQQLRKIESLNRMAGAIAHHFNNQFHVVMGNLEMAIDGLPLGANPIKNLASAMQATQKAAEVSSLMLTFLGQMPGKHEQIDLSEVCRKSMTLLQAAAPKGTLLKADFPASGPVIRANAGQILQILTNLVANAWESVDENRRGIGLAVQTVYPSDIHALKRFPVDWQPLDPAYACLEVSDAGCGIAEKDFEKIFDPFFSTKFTGRGLGLPVVLGIVRAHHGAVTVESEPDRGSIFRVFFPVSVEEVLRQPDKEVQTTETEEGGTVLVVEDEEQVRCMVKTMLIHLGFTVLEAGDGVEAVDVFRLHRHEIRCVLCDLTMPCMDGWETLTALRQISPDIPVILSSGYDEAQVLAGEHSEHPNAFLGKPYDIKRLSDVIRREAYGSDWHGRGFTRIIQ